MDVDSNCYGGLGGDRNGGEVGRHAEQRQEVGRMSGDARIHSECEVNTLMTPDPTAFQLSSSW